MELDDHSHFLQICTRVSSFILDFGDIMAGRAVGAEYKWRSKVAEPSRPEILGEMNEGGDFGPPKNCAWKRKPRTRLSKLWIKMFKVIMMFGKLRA